MSLILSTGTKDQITHTAVQRLLKNGLTPEKICDTSDHDLETLIYPVGFRKVFIKKNFVKKFKSLEMNC